MEGMSHVKVAGPPGFPRDITFLSLIQEERPNNKSEFVFLENGVRLMFDDVWKRAVEYAKGMLALGVERGDTLSVVSSCSPETISLYLACICIGVGFSHPLIQSPHKLALTNTLPKLRPKILIVGEAGLEETIPALRELMTAGDSSYSFVEHVFYDNGVSGRELDSDWPRLLSDTIEAGRNVSDTQFEEAQAKVQPSDDMIYFTTSGSTGIPKVVVYTQTAMANGVLISKSPASTQMIYMISSTNIEVTSYGTIHTVFAGNGKKAVIMKESSFYEDHVTEDHVAEIAETIQSEGVTLLTAQKGYPKRLVEYVKRTGNELQSLAVIALTGQAYSPQFKKSVLANLKACIVDVYGSTEAGMVGISLLMNADEVPERALIKIAPHGELKLVDEGGDLVKRGEEGEIWFRSAISLTSYKNEQPEVVAKSYTDDGFVKIGDMGVLRDGDLLEVKGRRCDGLRFKINQKVVYPKEIENTLLSLPGIAEAAVISAQVTDFYGDEVTYCLVMESGVDSLCEDEVISHVVSRTSKLAKPCRIIYMDTLPWSSNGRKVSYKSLREDVRSRVTTDPDVGITAWYKQLRDSY